MFSSPGKCAVGFDSD